MIRRILFAYWITTISLVVQASYLWNGIIGPYLGYSNINVFTENSCQLPLVLDDNSIESTIDSNLVEPSELKDADYGAEIIGIRLNQAINLEDQLFHAHRKRLKDSTHPPSQALSCLPGVVWRDNPCKAYCKSDSIYTNYIDCYVHFEEDKKKTNRKFARYFLVSVENESAAVDEKSKAGEQTLSASPIEDSPKSSNKPSAQQTISERLQQHYRDLKKDLKKYGQSKDAGRHACIKKLFESTSDSRRIFSPYHPSKSKFKIQILRLDGTMVTMKAILAPIFAPMTQGSVGGRFVEPIDILWSLLDTAPGLFYRLLIDPLNGLPDICKSTADRLAFVPVIDPKPSTESRSRLPDHISGTIRAIRDTRANRNNPSLVIKRFFSQNASGISESLTFEIESTLLQVQEQGVTAELLDITHPLPFLTGSNKSPKTRACIGSSMFTRVICRDGLWIAIRGQNRGESFTCSDSIFGKALTTQEFYDFSIRDNPDLAYAKLHIDNVSARTGIFVIIIWKFVEMVQGLRYMPCIPIVSPWGDGDDETPKASRQTRSDLEPGSYTPFDESEHLLELRRQQAQQYAILPQTFPTYGQAPPPFSVPPTNPQYVYDPQLVLPAIEGASLPSLLPPQQRQAMQSSMASRSALPNPPIPQQSSSSLSNPTVPNSSYSDTQPLPRFRNCLPSRNSGLNSNLSNFLDPTYFEKDETLPQPHQETLFISAFDSESSFPLKSPTDLQDNAQQPSTYGYYQPSGQTNHFRFDNDS